MTVLAPDVEEFLREPNVAALSTVRPDGRPHVTPVWYEYDGKEFIISTPRGTQKLANVSRKGFAALSVHTQSLPYRHVIVEGTARAGISIDNVWRERVAVRCTGERAGKTYLRESGDWDVVALHVRPLIWWTQGFTLG
ncbi:MAG: PPOX class F420-dependent oxidoreductase [Chloroflexi bacterium]|nr:MAG: PPOX class F420-dependent oxidoreductase [Chloroflexota bacterium]